MEREVRGMGEVRWKGMISYISEEKHGVCYLLLLLTNGPQGLEGEHTQVTSSTIQL